MESGRTLRPSLEGSPVWDGRFHPEIHSQAGLLTRSPDDLAPPSPLNEESDGVSGSNAAHSYGAVAEFHGIPYSFAKQRTPVMGAI